MRPICWNIGYTGLSRFPPLIRSACAWSLFLAAVLISFIVSQQPLWAQSASRGSISRLIGQNRLEEAEKQLWSLLSQQPDQAWALDLMAEIRMRQKRTPEAEALFRRALMLDPKDVQAYRKLGELYRSLGNSSQATECYLHVVDIAAADVAAN